MFDGDQLKWNEKRIKGIVDFFGHKYFYFKKLADLGSGAADISGVLHRLGSDVTVVDIRQDHLKLAQKKFNGVKTIKLDFDQNLPFKQNQFDIILNLDLINHINNFENHLKAVCKACNHLVLELYVCDSNDSSKVTLVSENKKIPTLAFNGVGSVPSATYIERILAECGFNFKRQDDSKYNVGGYVYDWKEKNDNSIDINHRRIWFCVKNTSPIQFSTPKLQIIENQPIIIKNNITVQNSNTSINNQIIKNINLSNNKRIAVCLSGNLRSFKNCFNSLKTYLLDKYNCDVFISTWDFIDNPGDNSHNKTQSILNDIKTCYSPKKIEILNQIANMGEKYRKYIIENGRSPNAMTGMFYLIYKADQLRQNFETQNNFKYDVVVRVRPDLLLKENINIPNDVNGVYIPNFGHWIGINDQFAFGDRDSMKEYANLYNCLDNICDKIDFRPESLLKFHLLNNKINIKTFNTHFVLLRTNGSISDTRQSSPAALPPVPVFSNIIANDIIISETKAATFNKVAVVLSGNLRTFEKTANSFFTNYLGNLKDKTDVFIHTYDNIGNIDSYNNESISDIKTIDKLSEINLLYNPKDILIDSAEDSSKIIDEFVSNIQIDQSTKNNFRGGNLKAYSSMYYSMKKSLELMENYESKNNFKYDVIIRLRSDLMFLKPFDFSKAIDKILLPNVGKYYTGGMNDQFAIGNNHDMKIYLSLYDNLQNYFKNKVLKIFRPEFLIRYHLEINNIKFSEEEINYYILRLNGATDYANHLNFGEKYEKNIH